MEQQNELSFDTLVIGGGIAGSEAAINLANLNYKVILVEKDLSLGGKMIHLSKVFPTLDCAACITTPKVSETIRHPNITIYTYSEVKNIVKVSEKKFTATLVKKPRYVNEDLCTGCQECEDKCPVVVKDQFQYDLVGRKAVYVPFSIANPRVVTIDIENCILCGLCEKVCSVDAIDFTQEDVEIPLTVKSVIIATGFELFDPTQILRYGFGKYKNVVTAMQMERQLVPTRPYNSVLRPKDGKMPDNIAYVLCTGSRDCTVNNQLCSRVCCMYSIKQAQLIMGALPLADVSIYYIDIRTFGKGYEEFYQQAKGMGVNFVKGKVAEINEADNGNLTLHYENIEGDGGHQKAEHDLVILSTGFLPNMQILDIFKGDRLEADSFAYIREIDEDINPGKTSIDGVFVAGAASAARDIPDTILHSGAAVSQAAAYMERMKVNK